MNFGQFICVYCQFIGKNCICFVFCLHPNQVLFPLLYDLLTEVATVNITSNILEESRMRTATIMSKVFLHHLSPLLTLTTFSELWLDILDYIEKFMRVGSDMLHEAMLESLKNMLLVMHSVSFSEFSAFDFNLTFWI